MFGNMKIGTRLGLGFGLVLILLMVIAFIGISRLAAVNTSVEDIIHDKWKKTSLLQDGLVGVNEIGIGARDMALADSREDRQAAKDRVLAGRASIGKAWEALKPMLNQPKGIEMFQQVLESRERFIAAQNQVFKLTEEGRAEEARAFIAGDFRNVAVQYRQRVNALIKFQGDLMDQTGKSTAEQYQQARTLMLALAAIAILLGASIAVWVTRSITGPINQAVGVANQLAEGDLSMKIEVNSKDETGQLLAAMRDMVAKLTQIITEVRSASDNLSSASEEVSATAQSL
ncbi:MAG: methyl-accepting chemotaxis protein, partial [Hydrogenophilales bacterium 28-61-23]